MNPAVRYIWNLLVAFDQFANVAIFMGVPDETISAHSGRVRDETVGQRRTLVQKAWVLLADTLDRIQPNHSDLARHNDETRAEVVQSLEKDHPALK